MVGGVMELDLHGMNTYQAQIAVDAALRRCDTVAGYSKYVDFIRDRIHGKRLIETGMKGEVERCRDALAAAAAGADGIMIEVHNDPPHALCDGAQSLTPEEFKHTAGRILRIREAMKE